MAKVVAIRRLGVSQSSGFNFRGGLNNSVGGFSEVRKQLPWAPTLISILRLPNIFSYVSTHRRSRFSTFIDSEFENALLSSRLLFRTNDAAGVCTPRSLCFVTRTNGIVLSNKRNLAPQLLTTMGAHVAFAHNYGSTCWRQRSASQRLEQMKFILF